MNALHLDADLGLHSLIVAETADMPRRVLLGRKTRGFATGLLVMPGGKSDHLYGDAYPFSEEFRQANALRELHEETGIFAKLKNMGRLAIFDTEMEDISIDVYACVVPEAVETPKNGSDIVDIRWVAVDAIPYTEMPDDYSLWLPSVLSGKAVDAMLVRQKDGTTRAQYLFEFSPNTIERPRRVY